MPNHLRTTLDRLGIPQQPRYPMNTTADILGVSRDQVADLLRLGRLNGTKSSERRWAGVWHAELEVYMERIHEPYAVAVRLPAAPGSVSIPPPVADLVGVHPISMKDHLTAAMDVDPERLKERRMEPDQAADYELDC